MTGRLAQALQVLTPKGFNGDQVCFDKQLHVLRSPGRKKVIRASRRAGKSVLFAAALLEKVLQPPHTNVFYLAPTFKRAKRILWAALKGLNAKHRLGGIPNETEAVLSFPQLGQDVHVYLGGLKDRGEADKVRGIPGKLWIIDESQDNREDIFAYALKEAIEPGFLDYGGELWVGGTPGPSRTGYFFEIDEGTKRNGWEHHTWTWRDNVKLPRRVAGATVAEIEKELLEEFALDPTSPSWLREWCGQWTEDKTALVLQFDRTVNVCDWQQAPERGWFYVVAFDVGFNDADAIAVLGWRPGCRTVHLVHEDVTTGQDVTTLGKKLQDVINIWTPIRVVGDLGALGKKIGEEFRNRFGIPVDAADKTRKAEKIALLNSALRHGEFSAPPDSVFAQDAAKLSWDLAARARGTWKEAAGYHSDAGDAVLYGYSACLAYLEEAEPVRTPEEKEAADRLEEVRAVQAANREELERPWWESDAAQLGFG